MNSTSSPVARAAKAVKTARREYWRADESGEMNAWKGDRWDHPLSVAWSAANDLEKSLPVETADCAAVKLRRAFWETSVFGDEETESVAVQIRAINREFRRSDRWSMIAKLRSAIEECRRLAEFYWLDFLAENVVPRLEAVLVWLLGDNVVLLSSQTRH
jgi:hypothetical protein